MNPLTSIQSLSGDLLTAVISGLMFVEESGVPVPFAPGDVLLLIAGIAIASDTVEPLPMLLALTVAITLGAMVGREVFSLVGRAALLRVAEVLRFRKALDRACEMMLRGGARAVFVGRLVPGLRIHTTEAAGITRMPRATFALGLIPSVLVYEAVFVGLGALAGQRVLGVFHRAEHRLFVLLVSGLIAVAILLSLRFLVARGALAALEPVVLGVRRELADRFEAELPWHGGPGARWRQYPLVRRFWAGVVDLALIFATTILILTAAAGLADTDAVFEPPGLLLLGLVTLTYRVPLEARWGQTLGKRAMGISVAGPHGGVPGLWRSAVRNILLVIPPIWPIDLFLLLGGRRRQRLGELASQTTIRRVAL